MPCTVGEWWNGDTDTVEAEAIKFGGGPNVSDAYTINGQPGLLYPCSDKGIYTLLRKNNVKTSWDKILYQSNVFSWPSPVLH